MANCDKCKTSRVSKPIEVNVWCRACAPGIDRIKVMDIEFRRNPSGSLVIDPPNNETAHIMSPAMARDLATFLIQNFCAPEDY